MVALGLVIVYRSTGHINFAHGELFMIGSFFAYSFITQLHVPYILALLCAVALTFVLGAATDRLVFRRLSRSHDSTLVLATVGLSFFLKGISRLFWGGRGEYLTIPPIVNPAPIFIAGIPILTQQLILLVAAVVIMLACMLFFRATLAGKMMQAVAENPLAAYLAGIRVEQVRTWTWGASAAIAGAAGVLIAPLSLLTPDIGFGLLIKAFAATVLGGLGSVTGAVVGGFCVGLIESLAGGYLSSSLQDVSAFIIIMIVLVVRPSGLFRAYRLRRA